MKEQNKAIKQAMKKYQVPTWRLAELSGVSETTMFRRLRHEIDSKEKTRLLELIEKEATRHE